MKRMAALLFVTGAVFLAAGCDKVSETLSSDDSCSSEVAKKTMREMFVDAVEEGAREENKNNANNPNALRFDLAKIRATADGIGFGLEDVITTKKDPNSSKKFCEAQLTLTIPSAVLDDANTLRKEVGEGTIQNLAEDVGFRVDLNKFKSKISYNVQPTDSGDKLYTEVEGVHKFTELMATTVQYSALRALRVASQGVSTQKVQEKFQQEKIMAQEQLEEDWAPESAQPGEEVYSSESAYFVTSFDCNKSFTEVEKLVCSDRNLAQLDVNLARSYEKVMRKYASYKDTAAGIKMEQRSWLKDIRNTCGTAACLESAYIKRIRQLDAYAR